MSNEDKQERLVAEINAALKERAKADPRTIKEVVESALEREFATAKTAAVERRIEEKEQRIQTLKREINERERELAHEKDEKSRLETQLEEYGTAQEQKLQEARETLKKVPKEPDNPAIKNWAKELGMTPEALIDELEEDST